MIHSLFPRNVCTYENHSQSKIDSNNHFITHDM